LIYLAFTLWLLLTLLIAAGVHRLWTRLCRPAWVSWALLPGTLVSEMAYIFGCLITGGEIRHARIMPGHSDGRTKRSGDEPTTEAKARLKFVGPVIASLVSIVACMGAILVAYSLLGKPVISEFVGLLPAATLPKELPGGAGEFWDQLQGQVNLLRRMTETLGGLDWTNWRVGLFIYFGLCFSVRLAPIRKPARPTIAAVAVIALVVALAAAVSERFGSLVQNVWPLLTYVWTSLLFVLLMTLIATGIAMLVRALMHKGPAGE